MRTPDRPTVDPLPRCSIRANCRWFDQQGADACRVCPFVITDLTSLETEVDATPPPAPQRSATTPFTSAM
jgi:hypothetical protein